MSLFNEHVPVFASHRLVGLFVPQNRERTIAALAEQTRDEPVALAARERRELVGLKG